MKFVRHGNPKGLDIDYTVFVDSVEDIEHVHETLKSNGLLFLYQRGDKPYDPESKSLIVLHYIDPRLKLYDYSFKFDDEPKPEDKPTSPHNAELDKAYAKAKKDPKFRARLRKYMELHSLIHSFWKHLRAYGRLSDEHEHVLFKILKRIKKETGEELTSAPSIESLQNLDSKIKHFFEV